MLPFVADLPTGCGLLGEFDGEVDDVVPLSAVLDWARPQNLPLVVVPGGEHFFHGRLQVLQQIITQHWRQP